MKATVYALLGFLFIFVGIVWLAWGLTTETSNVATLVGIGCEWPWCNETITVAWGMVLE